MSVVAAVASDACSFLFQEDGQELIDQSLSQGGMIGSHGATAQPQDGTTKGARQLNGRHSLKGSNLLFEFSCDKDSNLGTVGAELGVHVIRSCKEHINLENPGCIGQ